jgi:hypothetical protein
MKMEKRLDELLARPPVYTKTDGSDTELDKLKKSIVKHRTTPPSPPSYRQRSRTGRTPSRSFGS